MKKKLQDTVVVIPSIGERNLFSTIESLCNNDWLPAKIIICIPRIYFSYEFMSTLSKKYGDLVELIILNDIGQVKQRIHAFHTAQSYKFVIQADADVILPPNAVKELYLGIRKLGQNAALGVIFSENNSLRHSKIGLVKYLLSCIRNILINAKCKEQPGSIYLSGLATQHKLNIHNNCYLPADWLPGGCIIHYSKNLILENYYPFAGKAYCEDLLHSIELSRKGIKLFTHCQVVVNTPIPSYTSLDLISFLRFLTNDFKARRLVIMKLSLSYSRMLILYCLIVLNYSLTNIYRLFFKWRR